MRWGRVPPAVHPARRSIGIIPNAIAGSRWMCSAMEMASVSGTKRGEDDHEDADRRGHDDVAEDLDARAGARGGREHVAHEGHGHDRERDRLLHPEHRI
jgi:hypothetical protein